MKTSIERQIITFLVITFILSTTVFVWLFNDLDNREGIASYLVSEKGIVIAIVYVIVGLGFRRIFAKKKTTA